jgi:peptidyl-prolyl cis-trans isomerase B (cyclophilin B)
MWWLAAAFAADTSTLQHVHELEWARADVVQLASQIPGADPVSRAAAVTAMGRLRNPDALDALIAQETDPDERVRVAVAEALGWTPGSAAEIRRWLAEQPASSTPAELARAEHGVEVALIEGLGFQDQPQDVALLVRYLSRPWPVGAAAAKALGRLAIHKVAGVDAAAGPLAARLSAVDPRMAEDAAWALSRVGLKGADPAAITAVQRALRGGSYETTRALLVKAAWPVLDKAARDDLFLRAATDPSRLVRVAVLNALQRDDVGAEVLAAWLADPDPWVREAAIDALGREGGEVAEEELKRFAAGSDDPWERAAAIRALGVADPGAAADVTLPPVVRAAEVEQLGDAAAWEKLAASDPDPTVRSAAAGALLDGDGHADVGARLLAAKDPAVREAAVELVTRGDRKSQLATLIPHLRAETDADVLADGLVALAKLGAPYPPDLDPLIERAGGRAEGRVRVAAGALAKAAGRPAPAPPAAPEGQRELVLASGKVVKVEAGRPSVEVTERIQRATVVTSEGSFVIDLDPETAPLAVANFARLAESGFFDGLVFHRVVPGFVVQTGDPRGDGWGGPGYVIPDEVSGVEYDTGSVGMARSDRDTGGSQWFVTTSPQPHLTGEYTRFGEVVDGMQVVKRLHPGSTLISVTIERLPVKAAGSSGNAP